MKILIAIETISLIYTIILLIAYVSKEKIKTSETRLFLIFLIAVIIGFIVEIINNLSALKFYFTKPQVPRLAGNIYMVHYIISYSLFMIYLFFKIFRMLNKDKMENKKANKIAVIMCLLAGIVTSIIFVTSKQFGTTFDGKWYYATGKRTNIVIAYGILFLVVNLIAIVISFIKKASNKEKISFISMALITLSNGLLRKLFPFFTINNTVNSLIILILFFAIENPDLELIGKLENSNNAKQDFLSSMSHELKTPLNIILGLSNNIGNDETTLRNDMNNINVEALALSEIFSNIIDMNTIDNGCTIEEKVYNIKDIITPLVNEYNKRLTSKGLELKVFCDALIPKKLVGDHEKILNATRKLLSNAAKYTTAGTVTLNISGEENNDTYLLKIEVKDTGKGIEKSQFDKIFKEFGRSSTDVNSATSGIGLGLTICKLLVYKMNGRILLGSEPGIGSTFIIQVPQRIATEADEEAIESPQVEKISIEKEPEVNESFEEIVIDSNEETSQAPATLLTPPGAPLMPAPKAPAPPVESLDISENDEPESLDIEIIDSVEEPESLEIETLDEVETLDEPQEESLDVPEEPKEPEKPDAPAKTEETVDTASIGVGIKALIVDDNALNIKVGKKIIQSFGVEVTEAGSGDECINRLNEGTTFDFIFMDIMMPQKDGVETMHEVRYLGLPVEPVIVALTADAAIGSKERYLKEGFDDYISKPLTPDEVVRIINTYKK